MTMTKQYSEASSKILDADTIATKVEAVLGPDVTVIGRPPQAQRIKKRKGRGRAQRSIELVEAMTRIAHDCGPITGRGVGYKLFVAGLIPSMSRKDMARVYRLLKEEREYGTIPWELIVDETRGIEIAATWSDPADFAKEMTAAYHRDFWNQQPVRCQVWSEKGTARGVLKPVLDEYGVGFNPVHGFNSATNTYSTAQDNDGRELVLFYVGDYDPSGLYMSEADLPKRLAEYGGDHVDLRRIALSGEQCIDLPSFPVTDKRKDPRFKWFTARHGDRCWELDAMDPRDLRDCVEAAIKQLIEPIAWQRCESVNKAERESLQAVLGNWNGAPPSPPPPPPPVKPENPPQMVRFPDGTIRPIEDLFYPGEELMTTDDMNGQRSEQ
jgi:hypothetical protein